MTSRSSNASCRAISCGAWALITFASSWASAQSPLSLDEKLVAIRQGFVQAAIEGPTKVQSTVWIDSKGALQESSSFRTGMEVRGVKILSYARDERGEPTATLSWQPEPDKKPVQPVAKPDTKSEPSCDALTLEGALKHVIGFDINAGEDWSVDEMSALRAATTLWAQQWVRSSTGNVQWKPRLGPSNGRSAYEKAFLGSSADEMPWRVNLTVRPLIKRPAPTSASASSLLGRRFSFSSFTEPNVHLSFTLTARNQQSPIFEASAELAWEFEAQNWSAPELSQESQKLLLQQIKRWSSETQKLLACEPVMPEVILTSTESLRINAGSLAGLRIGDEFMLTHGKNFIKKILEPGMVSENVMAKVTSVSEHHAQLQVAAGAKKSVQVGWRAWTSELNR